MAHHIDLEEIAKLESYISEVQREIERIGIVPRTFSRYAFDTIAFELLSKVISVSKACLALVKAGFPDEAYGLSRTAVECALILRYLTAEPDDRSKRASEFAEFSLAYKNYWLYHARRRFAGQPEAEAIEREAKKWNLTGDPKPALKHWSRLRAFTWKSQTLTHPLDGTTYTEDLRTASYAVDYYFQTSQFVHSSQPALDNFFVEAGTPFRFIESSGAFDAPHQKILYILLDSIHTAIAYALFGLNCDRPARANELFSATLSSFRPFVGLAQQPPRSS